MKVALEESVTKFFDFYTMYELYMRAGGFREEGYKGYPVFVNERIWEKIRDKYEEVVDTFFVEVYDALVTSVGREVRHFPKRCNNYAFGSEPKFYDYVCKTGGITKDMIRAAKEDVETYADVVVKLFSVPKWSCSYGGKKWAKAAQMILDAKRLKTRHDKVVWCDQVLHLHHNTGHLLNKTSFKSLSEPCIPSVRKKNSWVQPLNFRHRAKSVVKFIPYVSFSVAKLAIPRKRLLENFA